MERYSIIDEKNKREIVLLRGTGCKWRKCTFCDYHLDFSKNEEENYNINREALDLVTGKYNKLEVINSGSFCDLDSKTREMIDYVCKTKEISEIHFECHWMHRNQVKELREHFREMGIAVKVKIGVETFDAQYREQVMRKGIEETDPEMIAKEFDEVCLLFGLSGQTIESMEHDVETGLCYFERVCINIMVENTTKIKPDKVVIQSFIENIYPKYVKNERVDILLQNTDFGVGD